MSVKYPTFEELEAAIKKNPTVGLSISDSGPNFFNSGVISLPSADIAKWKDTYQFPTDFMKPPPDRYFEALDKIFNPELNGVKDAFDSNKNGVKQFGYDLQDALRETTQAVLGETPPKKPEESSSSSLLLLLGAGGLILSFVLLR